MLIPRVIPVLLLSNDNLVKTVQFRRPAYIGDPVNTVRIFNELEVDELAFLDIDAARQRRPPDLPMLRQIANECFMPLSYGGGLESCDTIAEVLAIGFEKVILNTAAFEHPELVTEAARQFGSQSIVVSIDVRRRALKGYRVLVRGGTVGTGRDPVEWARKVESLGAGEILLTSIDREGTWSGPDIELTRMVVDAVSIPLIAHGGVGSIDDIGRLVHDGGASGVALGSMVVYQKKGMGVLVNFPDRRKLAERIRP